MTAPGVRGRLLLIGWLGLVPVLRAGTGVELTPPAAPGGPLAGKATPPAGTQWVVVFYRIQGAQDFDSFNLDPQPDGTFAGTQDLPGGEGAKVEYYAAIRAPGGISYLPAGAPESFGTLQMPGTPAKGAAKAGEAVQEPAGSAPPVPAAPPVASGPPAHGPLYLDGSFERIAHHQDALPDERRNLGSGQVRLTLQKDEDGRQVLLNTRLVYTNQPMGTQTRWSLGELQAAFAQGGHRVQLGDQLVQESEFTLAGAGRRGFDYAYTGTSLGAHLFALNTEAQAGARGLVWPVAGSEAYGGALGYGWLNGNLKAKLVFLSGKDDPATAINVVTTYAAPVRDGSTGALLLDGRFLDSRLALSGEYARSLFTKDLLNASPRIVDQAWRLSGMWSQGPFSAQVGYRDVGRDFGTVGVVFFVGDRRAFNGSLGLNYARWSLSATATDERVNPSGQPDQNQAWNQSQRLDARVGLTQTLFWRVGLQQSRQDAGMVANPLVPFSDSSRSGVSTGFDLALPPATSLTFNAQFDRIRSTGMSDTTGSSTTLSLGGSLGLGARVRLSPSLSWSRTLNDPGAQKTTVENAFLNADVALVPNILGFLLNGGSSRTTLVTGETMENAVAEGTLRWFLDGYLHGHARASLGLKGRYTHAPSMTAYLPTAASGTTGATAAAMANDNQVSLLLNVSY
ncbi:MAG TPA: hypothetical protein VF804_03590 [Holophagaceae bacterium]